FGMMDRELNSACQLNHERPEGLPLIVRSQTALKNFLFHNAFLTLRYSKTKPALRLRISRCYEDANSVHYPLHQRPFGGTLSAPWISSSNSLLVSLPPVRWLLLLLFISSFANRATKKLLFTFAAQAAAASSSACRVSPATAACAWVAKLSS